MKCRVGMEHRLGRVYSEVSVSQCVNYTDFVDIR